LALARAHSCPPLGPAVDTRDLDLDFHDLVTEPLTYPSLFSVNPLPEKAKTKGNHFFFSSRVSSFKMSTQVISRNPFDLLGG
jgi:hypothetical protein